MTSSVATEHPSWLSLPCVPSVNPKNKPSFGIELSTVADDDPRNKFCLAVDLSVVADDDPSNPSSGVPCAFASTSNLVATPGPSAVATSTSQALSSSVPLVTPIGEPLNDYDCELL